MWVARQMLQIVHNRGEGRSFVALRPPGFLQYIPNLTSLSIRGR